MAARLSALRASRTLSPGFFIFKDSWYSFLLEAPSAKNEVCKCTDIFNNSWLMVKDLSRSISPGLLLFVLLFFFINFRLLGLIAAVVCYSADSVIGYWLLSSARK
jgi:hypothetical protein